MLYTESVLVQKPAGVLDGYFGGLSVSRDASRLVGGIPGNVNTALTIHTVAGKSLKTFEWNALFKLDNYSDFGENCAFYSQANKLSVGSSWGGCIEVCDNTNGLHGGAVGLELDVWANGPDTGSRVGLDITCGNASKIRGGPLVDTVCTFGLRVGASSATPTTKWAFGATFSNFLYAGLHLNSKSIRGVQLQGEYIVGLDISEASTQTAIRLAYGQRVSFDQYDQITLCRNPTNGRLSLFNAGIAVFEIDITTGDLYKRGVKVL